MVQRRSQFLLQVVLCIALGSIMPARLYAGKQFLWVTNAYGNDVHIFDVATWLGYANF